MESTPKNLALKSGLSNNLENFSHVCTPFPIINPKCLSQCSFCCTCGAFLSLNRFCGWNGNQSFTPYKRSTTFSSETYFHIDLNSLFLSMSGRETTPQLCQTPPHFLEYRSQLIDLIEILSQRQKFQSSTFSLAICYLDEICSRYNFKAEELSLIAIICINMAAKMEENEEKVLTVDNSADILEYNFPLQKIIEAEQIVFKELGFRLHRETAFHFGIFFLSRGVISPADVRNVKKETENDFLKKFEELVITMIRRISRNYHLSYEIKASLLAAAVIYCVRKLFGFSPWTTELESLTQRSESCIEPCADLVWSLCIGNNHIAFNESLTPFLNPQIELEIGSPEKSNQLESTIADTINDNTMEEEYDTNTGTSIEKEIIKPRYSLRDIEKGILRLGDQQRHRYSHRGDMPF